MNRDFWTRQIDRAATTLISVIHQADFARVFGGLVSVYVGYKLFRLGVTTQPPGIQPESYALFTSGIAPGLIFIAFGVIVIPGKLEHIFNQYVLVIVAGIISIVLGYALFKAGIVEAGKSELQVESAAYKLILSGQAPGLFFMFFGAAILIFYLWTMRPQKEIVAAQAEETRLELRHQYEMIQQIFAAIAPRMSSPPTDPDAQERPRRAGGAGSGTSDAPTGV